MNEWGDGPPEIDPDIAAIQARQRGPSVSPGSGELPATAFVASINALGGAVTLQAGTLPAGIGVNYTQGANTISFNLTGIDPIATKKSNLAAAVAPTVNEDSGDGYAIGSIWIDTVLNDVYMATNVSVGASVWRKLN